jgi:hypothetical protein
MNDPPNLPAYPNVVVFLHAFAVDPVRESLPVTFPDTATDRLTPLASADNAA